MSDASAEVLEERRKPRKELTESELQQVLLRRLALGDKQFSKIGASLKLIETKLDHNTTQTDLAASSAQKAVELAQKAVDIAAATAKDTEGVVAIEKFGKGVVEVVTIGVKKGDFLSKFLIRLLVLVGVVAAIWSGKWPDWKSVLEALR